MRGGVARVEQLRDEAARLVRILALEFLAEYLAPVVEDRLQQAVDVEWIVWALPGRAARIMQPFVAEMIFHVGFNETIEQRLQRKIERVANALGALDVPGHGSPLQST